METFFKVKTPTEVYEFLDSFTPSTDETVRLEDSLCRVLSQDVVAPEDLPGFPRASMDGYAVRARDTFGANESLPAMLEVCGEVLMGQAPDLVVREGEAAKISTGGMVPEGADAVVMVEYCHALDTKTIEAGRAVSPLENIMQPGDDVARGAVILAKGRSLRPQDMGVLAALGVAEVKVWTRPTIAIISTGDEVVPIGDPVRPGQVRDVNRYTLGALCERAGAEPLYMGICPDRQEPLRKMVCAALEASDAVWLSGGSSVGTRDLTVKVFETLPGFELAVHGVSISPGKPAIFGVSGRKPLVGLPGQITSAVVVAEVFLVPLLGRLSGRTTPIEEFHTLVEVEVGRNVESASGREDYVRVRLAGEGDRLIAYPIFGKSGLISPLVEADALLRIDMNTEGLYRGQQAEALVLGGR